MSVEFKTGLRYGTKIINDPQIKETYGNSFYLTPFLSTDITKWLAVEVSYEIGNKSKGVLGEKKYPTTLQISGFTLSLIAHYQTKAFNVFFKMSFGYYGYRQKIDNPLLTVEVDHHQQSVGNVGCGVDISLNKNFFITNSIRYITLYANPFERRVNLTSWAISTGLGFKFSL